MSVPATPDTHPAAASVTPGGYSIERSTLGERFEPSVLDLIVGLLAPDTSATVALRTAIDAVFVDRWQATTWADLMVFTSTDVAAAFTPGPDIPVEATAPVVVKKLGYVVDFARIGALTPNTTMNDIVQSVSPSHRRATVGGLPHSPSRNLMQVFDKKAVPTIEKFNGHDEDYFTWKESTINALGTAGFSRFLDDKTVVSRHPEVAESVFYSLRGAVYGGQAQSIAQRMLDEKNLDPTDLWSALEDYYDTALNRANVVLFDIRRLLHLRLDPDNPASKFISAYRECLQRLRKNHARLSDDTDTLRALLLVAIQDDDFEMVRDSIVHKPDLSVESILTELRERETSLMMRDQASRLGGDGSSGTRVSRRAKQASSKKGGSNASSGGRSTAEPGNNFTKWSIPRYPDSWKKAFGGSLFKLLLDWRNDAHKGKTQDQLISEYATTIEKIRPASTSKSGTSSGGSSSNDTSTTTTAYSTGGSSDQQGDNAPARKRIRLQKSRRVVTERAA